ncbi:MAG: hypothetical protein H7839_23770, partial [Magnetococcus sp. YQC-5]
WFPLQVAVLAVLINVYAFLGGIGRRVGVGPRGVGLEGWVRQHANRIVADKGLSSSRKMA